MTNKEKVEQDILAVKAAIRQLKADVKLLRDEERAELKDKINAALDEYSDPKAGETWPDISLYLHWNFGHCRRG